MLTIKLNPIHSLALMLIFSCGNSLAQELKEFQQSVFCTPVKSEVFNSIHITRVQNLADEYPYIEERIKFKLVYSDYLEVVASTKIDGQMKISTQRRAVIVDVLTTYFNIRFFGPAQIWSSREHHQQFLGLLTQDRFQSGAKAEEFECVSRLSKPIN